MDFAKTVKDVHPSLHGTNSENATNISDSTLEGLTQTILKLKAEKRTRVSKVIPLSESTAVIHFLFVRSLSNYMLAVLMYSVARNCGKTPQVMESDGVDRTRQETLCPSSLCSWIF
jgi:protein regulator of cytokinesis 1